MANMTTQEILQGIKDWAAPKVIYDISAAHNNTKYTDLADALGTDGENIPQEYKKGGITVRFVCTYDNKYVQYRLMAQTFTTDVTKWAICDDGVLIDNPEFVEVKLDNEHKILWAIKKDGSIFFGAGCPPQVQEYVLERKEEIILELATKVDKVQGKGLSTNDYTNEEKAVNNICELIDNSEYMSIDTDKDGRILSGRKANGVKFENMPQETPMSIVGFIESNEYIEAVVDEDGKIIRGTKKDGSTCIHKLIFNEANGDVANVNILNLSKSGIVKLQSDLANEVLPAYWNTYLDGKLSAIDTLVGNTGNHGDLLLFFSDYHYIANTRYTPEIIKKLYNRLGRVKVFNCGDVLNTHATKDICLNILQTYNESFAGVDLYNVFGNHDNNPYGTQPLDIDDYYPLLFKPLESNPNVSMTTKGYYYVDNKVQKIRYIVLNTYGTGLPVSDTEQLNWFCGVLNSVEDGWHVVVLCHMMYEVRLNSGTGLHQVEKTSSGYLIMAICDAYQDKQSGTYSTYNFDFTNAHGNMACILVGHIHYDYSEQSEAGYPVISILQDAIDYPGSMEDNPERKKGTYTEQAFDIISIDTVGKTVKTVRMGAGENRNFTFE